LGRKIVRGQGGLDTINYTGCTRRAKQRQKEEQRWEKGAQKSRAKDTQVGWITEEREKSRQGGCGSITTLKNRQNWEEVGHNRRKGRTRGKPKRMNHSGLRNKLKDRMMIRGGKARGREAGVWEKEQEGSCGREKKAKYYV